MEKVKAFRLEFISLCLTLLVFGFSFAPIIVASGNDGVEWRSIYETVNYAGNRLSPELITAFIFLSIGIITITTLLILSIKGIRLGASGFLNILSGLLLIVPGFLFAFGKDLALEQKKLAFMPLRYASNAVVGWGTVVCSCLCFLASLSIIIVGVKQVVQYVKEENSY